jgi:hypothetical protein
MLSIFCHEVIWHVRNRSIWGLVDGCSSAMTDWQRGVDWLMAEYCWCRWRKNAKGLSREVERQVGLVRGIGGRTWSSAGRMVSKKQDKVMNLESVHGSGLQLESPCGVWLVYSTKPTPSGTTMAAKLWWGWCGGGCEVCSGFPTKLSGSLVEPQSQERRLGRRRWDPGVPWSFEAGDTRRDREACVRWKQDCSRYVFARWKYPLLDQSAPGRCVSSMRVAS